MIVNYKETGWEVITQRSHGLLAAQIGMHWKQNDRPERWVETLIAIAEHDDAEVELDGENLLTEAGGPLNFAMKAFELKHCQKLSMLTITKSRFIALLASMHMQFLHSDEAKENKVAHQFLEGQKRLQEEWRQSLHMDATAAKKAYYLLEWCDALSLLLCRRQVQPEKRSIEISTGTKGKVYHLLQVSEGVLTVEPWPFESKAFWVSYESRNINQLQFDSSADFRTAFTKAPIEEHKWKFEKKAKVKRPGKLKP